MNEVPRRARVAIIGGGCAGTAAAFELTQPWLADRFDVTIYQQGWRLGGKGASGRGPSARIEEHGLHLWMGYYENAFRMLRECYTELARDPATCRIADWRDAFSPVSHVGVEEQLPGAGWDAWLAHLPMDERLPGEPHGPELATSMRDYLVRATELANSLLRSVTGDGPQAHHGSLLGLSTDTAARATPFAAMAMLGATAEILAMARQALTSGFAGLGSEGPVAKALDSLSASLREHAAQLADQDPAARRIWYVLDVVLATMRGILRFGLAGDPRGFDAVDEYDYREWLWLNGASQDALDSPIIRALYDLGFAYEGGDLARPRFSAGQGLRSASRAFFSFKGAFFWKMSTGMGDAVFAPMYEVLKRRQVRFEFFHRLEALRLSPIDSGDTPHVEGLQLSVQADVLAGEYRPLVDIDGLPCWPAAPLWDQLADGEDLRCAGVNFETVSSPAVRRLNLRVGADFDFVVLAVGLGAIPLVARELVERDGRWQALTRHVKTVATQSFQVWLAEDLEGLGWEHGSADVSGFTEPFDTWADMSHLVGEERFVTPPRSIAYFCSVLPDSVAEAADAHAAVRSAAIDFLDKEAVALWPKAVDGDGHFRWELLREAGADPGDGTHPFDTQYWRANVEPSERYTLSVPGSAPYRVSPLDDSYDNLTVAGDWTDCGYNAGCVEAAVMSGRLAAHALSGSPPLEEIAGYDHP